MDSLVFYAIWAVIILCGLGLLAMVVFGVRSLTYGKVSPLSIGIIIIPVVILLVLFFMVGEWAVAGIWTVVIMLVLGFIGLLVSGSRGLIGM